MSPETSNHQPTELQQKVREHRERGRGRRFFWFILAALAVVAVLYGAPGCSRHGRWHHQADGALEVGEAEERLERAATWIADEADATDEQREGIAAAFEDLAPEWVRLRAEREALKARLATVLAAEEIDSEALSAARADALVLVTEASRRALDALTEVAGTLEVEQRRELIAQWKEHR